MTEQTIFWHDYETWGVDPRRDRASQFAGIRTNLDLEVVGEPVMFYCKPTQDFLPHPDAVRVTGIAPQLAFEKGYIEAEFLVVLTRYSHNPAPVVLATTVFVLMMKSRALVSIVTLSTPTHANGKTAITAGISSI